MERKSFFYTNINLYDRWQVLSSLISSLFRHDLVFVLGMFIDLGIIQTRYITVTENMEH